MSVDFQPQNPSWASEPWFAAFGCTDSSRGPDDLLLSSANLCFLGTCCGPKTTQEPDQKSAIPAFSFCHPSPIQLLGIVRFAFLT